MPGPVQFVEIPRGGEQAAVELSVEVRAEGEAVEAARNYKVPTARKGWPPVGSAMPKGPTPADAAVPRNAGEVRHGGSCTVGGAGFGVPHGDPEVEQGEAWKTFQTFRQEELRRRERNGNSSAAGRLFLSHCWRNPEQQRRKRLFVSELSIPVKEGGKGLTYWADFLDLQCDGPVPWQKEILEGIDRCSKVVAFVDAAYLMSVNCLKELAYALDSGKPVVMLIMDASAWELLTVPRGAQRAWEQDQWGPPLSAHEGEEFLPGEVVSVASVGKLYSRLAEINLCPCRPLEEANWTMPGLLRNMMEYVCKDIAYMKEHAVLKAAAMEWSAAGRPASRLLHPQESTKWHAWVALALDAAMKPPPTELQIEYVARSRSAARASRRRLVSAAAVLFLMILAAGIAAAVLAVAATRAEKEAAANARAASLWTVLGRLAAPSGSVSEQRALLAVLHALPDLKDREELYRPLAVEASRAFFSIASLPSLGVGLLDGLGRSKSLAWSPDGSAIAAAAEEQPGFGVRVQQLRPGDDGTTDSGVLLTGPSASASCIDWTSATRGVAGASTTLLAAGDAAGELHIWNGNSGELHTRINPFGAPVPVQHLAWRSQVAGSSGSSMIAVAGAGGALALCRLDDDSLSSPMSCERLVEAQRGAAPVFAVDWSPDGSMLASAGADGMLRLWNHTTQLDAVHVGPELHGIAFSPDASFLAVSTSNEQRLELFAVSASEVGSAQACTLACTALPILLGATVGSDVGWTAPHSPEVDATSPWLTPIQRAHAAVLGWNASSWAECAGCRRGDWSRRPSCDVAAVYLSGTCPASQLKDWDELSAAESLAAQSMGFTRASWAASSPYSCCHGSDLGLIPKEADNQTTPHGPPKLSALGSLSSAGDVRSEPIGRVAFSPNGKKLASGWQRGVRVWSLDVASPASLVAPIARSDANDVAWSPAGANSHLMAAALSPGTVPIVDTAYGGRLGLRPLHSQAGRTLDLTYDAGLTTNSRLITASYGTVHALDGATGDLKLSAATPTPGEWVNSLAVSVSGRIAVGVADPRVPSEGRVHLLDAETLLPSVSLGYAPGYPAVVGVAWSPDGSTLAAAVGAGHDPEKPRGVVLWNWNAVNGVSVGEDMEPRLLATLGAGSRVAFHPSRQIVAASTQGEGSAGHLHLWQLPDGEELPLPGALRHGTPAAGMFGIAWHGDRLAAGDSNGVVHVLYGDLGSSGMMQVERLQADEGITLAVDWSPDGHYLASGGTDGTVMIWNMEEAGKAFLHSKAEVGQRIFAVKWSPDGSQIAVGGDGGFVKAMPFIKETEKWSTALRNNLLPFTSPDFDVTDAVAIGLNAEAAIMGLRRDG